MYRQEISNDYLQHIIDGAHRKSFDPYKNINWDVPFDCSKFYIPEDMVSLYGTPLWDAMRRENRVRLSLHEATSTLSTGIWFENQLCFKLMDYLIDVSPHDPHFYWLQIEVADECRHSMMFGELIKRSQSPWYRPRFGGLFAFFTKYLTPKMSMMLGTLAAEAITDYLNRRIAQDPECHTAMRELSRIHIVEEARHLGYAREWLKENWPRLNAFQKAWARRDAPVSARVLTWVRWRPDVYKNVGLPPEARKIARTNPHTRETVIKASEEMVEFFQQLEIIDAGIAPKWRAAGLMA